MGDTQDMVTGVAQSCRQLAPGYRKWLEEKSERRRDILDRR